MRTCVCACVICPCKHNTYVYLKLRTPLTPLMFFFMSSPAMKAVPLVGFRSPVRILKVVVLPAPTKETWEKNSRTCLVSTWYSMYPYIRSKYSLLSPHATSCTVLKTTLIGSTPCSLPNSCTAYGNHVMHKDGYHHIPLE